REGAVPPHDRVPRVLPALVLETGLGVAALVLDIAVAVAVAEVVDPAERGARRGLELADERRIARPALVLVEQDEEQRRRVGAAVVRRMRALLEDRQLPEAQLVRDLAGLLVAEVVDAAALERGEHAQGRRRELWRERQRLEARDQAVTAEERQEPRQ